MTKGGNYHGSLEKLFTLQKIEESKVIRNKYTLFSRMVICPSNLVFEYKFFWNANQTMFSYLNFKRIFTRKRGWTGILPYVRRAYSLRFRIQNLQRLDKTGTFFFNLSIHASLCNCKRSLELWKWLTCFSQWTQKGHKEFFKLLRDLISYSVKP